MFMLEKLENERTCTNFSVKKCYILKKFILLMTADILARYLDKNKSDSKMYTTTVILLLGHTFKVIELLWPKAKSIKILCIQ